MDKELANFKAYGAYEEVEDVGQPCMSSGWIFTEKPYGDVIGAKARLVVYANQEGFTDSCDSPTVSKQSLRMQFTLAAQFGWELVMAEVTSAFLQSGLLDREGVCAASEDDSQVSSHLEAPQAHVWAWGR